MNCTKANSAPQTTRHKAVMKSSETNHPPQKQIDKENLIHQWHETDDLEEQQRIREKLIADHLHDPAFNADHSPVD